MVEERQLIRELARLIEEHTGQPVLECDPHADLPDRPGAIWC